MDKPPATSSRRARTAWLVALYCGWISAGGIPVRTALEGARAPSDFLRDYVAAAVLARGEPLSTLDGRRGNAEAARMGEAPVNIIQGSPFHLHPPPTSLLTRLLVPLGFRGASAVLLGLSVVLLGVLAQLLVAVSRQLGGSAPVGPVPLLLLLVAWPPTLANFELGQWSVLLATLIAAGFYSWETRGQGRGAAWMASAAALKLAPGLLFAFVALRSRRAAGIFAGVVLLAFAIALPLGGGLDAWSAFLRDAGKNVAEWQTWWHNTLSLNGFAARLFVGAHFARPLCVAPALARGLVLGAAALLVGTAVVLTRGGGPIRNPAREGCVFATWNVAIVVMNPLAWVHYALLLLLPATLVWRAAHAPDAPLSDAARARLRRAVAVAIVVLSVPKETLFLLARPLPSSVLAAPLLSIHMFAALLLFAAAADGARSMATAATGPAAAGEGSGTAASGRTRTRGFR